MSRLQYDSMRVGTQEQKDLRAAPPKTKRAQMQTHGDRKARHEYHGIHEYHVNTTYLVFIQR